MGAVSSRAPPPEGALSRPPATVGSAAPELEPDAPSADVDSETRVSRERAGADAEAHPLAHLVPIVTERIGVPLDYWAVAACLEATGMRDLDAREKYDYEALFPLASDLYELIMASPPKLEASAASELVETTGQRVRRVLKHLFEGSFFAMPMIGQIICILCTRYSLWASLDFQEQQATLIGLGTVASFAVTGGVVMTIGRQGTVYRAMKAFRLLRRVCLQLVMVGFALALASLLIASVVNLVSPFLTSAQLLVAALYYCMLCGMWLSLGLLYMLGRHAWSSGVTVVFGLFVAVQVRWLGVGVETAQLFSIGCATTVAFAVAIYTMRAMGKDEDPKHAVAEPPPPDVAAGILAPFAAYGLGYFAFLFLDRLLAWTAPGRPLPMPVWFHTPYELGMDWALISLLAPMAYLEHVVHEFGPRIMREQERFLYHEVGHHRRSMLGFGIRAFVVVFVFSVVSVIGTYFAVQSLRTFDDVQEIRDFFASEITEWVFWVAAVAYQFLTWALMVGLLYFTLARGEVVVRHMWRCLVIGLVVGFTTSRIVAPEWAVVGFAAGSLYFAVAMGLEGFRLGRRIDYFYYSAF